MRRAAERCGAEPEAAEREARAVERQIGLVDDGALASYVRALGARFAAASQGPAAASRRSRGSPRVKVVLEAPYVPGSTVGMRKQASTPAPSTSTPTSP